MAPKLLEIILVGDLNVQVGDPHDKHQEDLVIALVNRGLVNNIYPFMAHLQYRVAGSWTWSM